MPETKRLEPIRLVVVDDHPIVLEGLERLFRLEGDLEIVARCVNAREALEAVRLHQPDILLLDVRLSGGSGIDVLEQIRREGLTTRAVLLAGSVNQDELMEALRLGARGIVLKEMAPELLIRCIRTVHGGGRWLEDDFLSRAIEGILDRDGIARPGRLALSAREMEVVRLVATGHHNRDIAEALHIAEGTVKVHMHNVYEKLGVEGRVELTIYARDHGWV
ncbi:MAG TPA: response regulator transcription factor [Thermoanaerobaculia bacterium]|nr:response regulator transcription factor [Thermoanaerobaculia bacterium]